MRSAGRVSIAAGPSARVERRLRRTPFRSVGILVKDRLALERSRTVDAFLFDKTGTLTEGEHTVVGVAGTGISEDEVLRLAGAVESDSEHPLARAIGLRRGRGRRRR